MRTTHIITILFAAFSILLTSCEKIIEFNKQEESSIAIFALATPDEPFSVMISKSFTVNTAPSRVEYSYRYSEETDSLFEAAIVIKDALVEITVNNTEKYKLTYNEKKPYNYTCDYVPKVGDDIKISVKAQGFTDAYATTHVYEPRKIEIVDKEVVYKDNGDDGTMLLENPFEYYGVDSVMRITLRINDPQNTHDFYRLKVRGTAVRYLYTGIMKDPYYTISDAFTSEDVIFIDNMLTKPFADWEAGISNVFDDHLFNGQDYTFTVETRKRYGDNPRVILELQTITPDFYYFMKSYLLFRISTDDSYTTPIGLYSNIGNGWGILGSLTFDRHIINY